jgi:hypothetical protein
LRKGIGKNLDGYFAIELVVPGTVHLAIPPAPRGGRISYGPSLVPGASDTRSNQLIATA